MKDDKTAIGRRTLLQALGLGGTVGFTGITAGLSDGAAGSSDELLVGIARRSVVSSAVTEIEAVLPSNASVVDRNDTLGYVTVSTPHDDGQVAQLQSRIESQRAVAYVEPNVTCHTLLAPNDPRYGEQYAPQLVNAPAAWERTVGSTDVTVAVVDTGADYTHPDLSASYPDSPGRDFVDDDGDPYPDAGARHGTHVSGCISANTDNGTGVAGISDSTLRNARCLGVGGGAAAAVADGIQWAADAGADIINMSLGTSQYSETLKRAVEYAYHDRDVLVICAAGNDATSPILYPARFDACVAVSALTPEETLAEFSSYGDGVEVAAPGVNVLSTVPTDSGTAYLHLSGTSMAAPIAAGVAALGKAVAPDRSAAQLREHLKSTAVDVGLASRYQGAGRVDAAAIVGESGDDGDDSGLTATPLYRLFNPQSFDHLYTISAEERDSAQEFGYRYEGVEGNIFARPKSETTPLYRLYHPKMGDHFYTISPHERDRATEGGYNFEFVAGHVYLTEQSGTRPLYRLYHPAGDHFYTTSTETRDEVVDKADYTYELVQCHVR
jgi:serine protease